MAQRTDNSQTPKVRPIAWRTAYPHLAEYERTRTPRSTETEGRLARLRRVRSARAARLQTLQASGVTVAGAHALHDIYAHDAAGQCEGRCRQGVDPSVFLV